MNFQNSDWLTLVDSGDTTPSNASDTRFGTATTAEITSITSAFISVETEDEEEFGEFQSASADALKQLIFAVDELGEDGMLLSRKDLELLSVTVTAFGLAEPVPVRLDTSSQHLHHLGKLALPKLNLARERTALNRVTALLFLRQGPLNISANDQADVHLAYNALKEVRDSNVLETVQNEVGIMRSVVLASLLISEEEMVVQLDSMLGREDGLE
jgi:hypothetical protein